MHLIFQLRTLAGAPMALLVLAGPAAGQRPAPAPTPAPTPPSAAAPIGRLTGVVVDSIHGGPLTRATVRVGTTGRSGVTSLGGIFVIDSVPAGEHVVRVTHPLLDSLYLSLVTPPLRVMADSTTGVIMALPTLATLMG